MRKEMQETISKDKKKRIEDKRLKTVKIKENRNKDLEIHK